MIKVECAKCGGKGHIRAFSGIQGGVCFSCGGAGYKMQKAPSRKSKTYIFSFLWEDKTSPNYRDGDFCRCFRRKARSYDQAKKIAKEAMSRNGSIEYWIEEEV